MNLCQKTLSSDIMLGIVEVFSFVLYLLFRVALFGTEVVAGSALFGTSKNLVAEPSLFGTVRKNILVA